MIRKEENRMKKYTVGKSVPSWGGADVQVITFIVTEDLPIYYERGIEC